MCPIHNKSDHKTTVFWADRNSGTILTTPSAAHTRACNITTATLARAACKPPFAHIDHKDV
eukprot:9367500-Lingulodinium_polyedra.AAC.1